MEKVFVTNIVGSSEYKNDLLYKCTPPPPRKMKLVERIYLEAPKFDIVWVEDFNNFKFVLIINLVWISFGQLMLITITPEVAKFAILASF